MLTQDIDNNNQDKLIEKSQKSLTKLNNQDNLTKLNISVVIIFDQYNQKLIQSIKSVINCQEIVLVLANANLQLSQIKPQVFDSLKSQFAKNNNQKPSVFKFLNLPKEFLTDNQINNFALAREWARKQTSSDWILIVDSDEVIIWENQEKIAKFLEISNGAGIAQRIDFFYHQPILYAEAGKAKFIRLFSKNDTGKFAGNVHERFYTSRKSKPAPFVIYHYPHSDISSFLISVFEYAKQASKNEPRSLIVIFLKLLIFPQAKFFYNYFCHKGILDGWRGLVYALIMSYHSLLVRIFAIEKLMLKKK